MQNGIEKLFSWSQAGSYPTTSVKNDLLENFKSSKEYRHAFVEEKIRTQLAIQTKTIREQRGMSRPTFAKLMGKVNSWVFRLEDPNQPPPTIPTLLKEAEAFDVDLEISFRPFSHLLNRLEHMTADSFAVPSFDEEVRENTFGSNTDQEVAVLWSYLQRSGSGKGGRIAPSEVIPFPQPKNFEMPREDVDPHRKIGMRVTRSERSRRQA